MKFFASIFLLLAMTLAGCKSHSKKDADKKAASTKAERHEESSDVDFQAFVGRLRKAVHAHDVNELASMMSTDFGYSLNPEKSGDGVFQFWEENNLWPELEGIIGEKFVKKGEFMVAPPQFANENLNYEGYRIGILRVNGSWKFAYFVNG